jgi:hypothetical protein
MYFFISLIIILSLFYIYYNRVKLAFNIIKSLLEVYFIKPNVIVKNHKAHINCLFQDGYKCKLTLPISYLPYNTNIKIFDENNEEIQIISFRKDSSHHVIGLPTYTDKKLYVDVIPYPDSGEESSIKTNIIDSDNFINWIDIINNSKESESELMEAYD